MKFVPFVASLIFACAAGARAASSDLEAVKGGRSITAEMLLLADQCSRGRALSTYCTQLFRQGIGDLQDRASSVSTANAHAALSAAERAARAHERAALQAAFDRLRAIEKAYEQAP